jgi:hypothetical protein
LAPEQGGAHRSASALSRGHGHVCTALRTKRAPPNLRPHPPLIPRPTFAGLRNPLTLCICVCSPTAGAAAFARVNSIIFLGLAVSLAAAIGSVWVQRTAKTFPTPSHFSHPLYSSQAPPPSHASTLSSSLA